MQLYGTYSKPTLFRPLVTSLGFLPDDGVKRSLVASASDEFDGATLDTVKWKKRYHDNGGTLDHYNDELQRYDDGHVLRNGCLVITSTPKPGTVGHAPSPSGIQYPLFGSQMIRSATVFRYGYVEFRAKFPPPGTLGIWPAGWLLSTTSWCGEYDILEYAPNGVTEHEDMLHCGNLNTKFMPPKSYWTRYADNNKNLEWGFWRPPQGAGFSPTYASDDFHIYGVDWTPAGFAAHIDGYPIHQLSAPWKKNIDGSLGDMVSFIFDVAVGGSWAAYNFTTPVPTGPVQTLLDYVRVYQVDGQSQIGMAPV